MKHHMQKERRVLNLAAAGFPEVPVFGHYQYCSARPGLATHTHPKTVEICYLERGYQTYRAGGREYQLVGGDVFVTAPDEPHDTGGYPEDRGVLYWLNLRIPKAGGQLLMLPPAESTLLTSRLCHLPERQFAGRPVLKQIFKSIFDLYDQPENAFRQVALANQLVRCILEVIQCAYRHEGLHCSPLIAAIVDRVKSCPEQDYSLADLAQEAGLSLSRFKTKFKAQMGVAPHEFILRCKMDEAKRLLTHEGRSVTETAMALGFSSSQYFATVFKRFTQQTPVEFCTNGPVTPLRPGRVQPSLGSPRRGAGLGRTRLAQSGSHV
ncbi:MAG TPA: AraC family transcriptional regulator [Bryobacteraceae bacterium]|nr:AraC family transcriptional regulator [Bryobacteraceae bacterium]